MTTPIIEQKTNTSITDVNSGKTQKAKLIFGDYPGEPPKHRFKFVIQAKGIWQEISLTPEQVRTLFQAWNEALLI